MSVRTARPLSSYCRRPVIFSKIFSSLFLSFAKPIISAKVQFFRAFGGQNVRYSPVKYRLALPSLNLAVSASQCKVSPGKRPAIVPNKMVSVRREAYAKGAEHSAFPKQDRTSVG